MCLHKRIYTPIKTGAFDTSTKYHDIKTKNVKRDKNKLLQITEYLIFIILFIGFVIQRNQLRKIYQNYK